MIFKVIAPVLSNSPKSKAFVYNKSRSVQFNMDLTERIRKSMRGSEKKFFHSKKVKGILSIDFDNEAPDQVW